MGDKLIGGWTQYKTFQLWERAQIVYKLTDHYALRASIPFWLRPSKKPENPSVIREKPFSHLQL